MAYTLKDLMIQQLKPKILPQPLGKPAPPPRTLPYSKTSPPLKPKPLSTKPKAAKKQKKKKRTKK